MTRTCYSFLYVIRHIIFDKVAVIQDLADQTKDLHQYCVAENHEHVTVLTAEFCFSSLMVEAMSLITDTIAQANRNNKKDSYLLEFYIQNFCTFGTQYPVDIQQY